MKLSDLRHIYGSVFLLQTPDGLRIPWKPLSIGAFWEYDAMLKSGDLGLIAVAENEIFKRCVLDQVIVDNLDQQKAGTITSLVQAVMSISGPQTPDEFNKYLDHNRYLAALPIHEFVTTICWAFPAYKPEDVLAMDYPTLMLRLAMAERKLLRSGIYQEPLQLGVQDEKPEKKEKKKKKYDPKKLAEAYQEQQMAEQKIRPMAAKNMVTTEQEDVDLGQTEQGKEFVVTSNMMMTGLEMGDAHEAKQMKADAKKIYADYLKPGPDGKVKIKSYEERVAAAHKRAEENAKRVAQRK